MSAPDFNALVIAPNSMILGALVRIIQGRCMIIHPGYALTGHGFDEIYAFGGDWENEPGMGEWIQSVRQRFNKPGANIIWIG